MSKDGTAFSLKNDQWVLPFFKQYKKSLLLALVLGLVAFVFAAALMFTSGYLITSAAEVGATIITIHMPLIFVRVFGVGKPFLLYFERLTSHDWVLRMTSSMRSKLYALLEKDAIFLKRKHSTGNILGLLSEDIGHLQNLYLRVVFPTIVAWLLYVIVVIVAGFFSWWLGLALLLLLGVSTIVMPLVSVLINGARQMQRKAIKSELYSKLTDDILGVSDWVFSQRGDEYLANYQSSESELRGLDSAMARYARNRDLVLQVVFGATAVVVALWAAGAFGGGLGGTSNWIAAVILGFFPLVDAFAPLSESATEANIYADSAKRLNALSQEESDIESLENKAPKDKRNVLEEPHSLTIEAKGVSFRYRQSQHAILNGMDIAICPGEKIAVLGRSGSGKSTLAALIRGDLEPKEGEVTLGGIPTSEFGDEISRYIGVVQQQTYLFNMSLLENMRIGNCDASEEEIWHALSQVGLDDMVKRLPDQLETMVDEAGLRFSGGERHRIALARVLLSKVPIVILDEPMVGLDPVTEQLLMQTIMEVFSDKTLILITHHLQGIAEMDRVVFLANGAIGVDGTPDELERSNPYYQKLLAFDKGL